VRKGVDLVVYGAVQTHIRRARGTDAETAVREPRRLNLID